jgi:diacylglycerol kinase (ATP)
MRGPDLVASADVNVWILCNEAAGRGLSANEIRGLVQRAGHAVIGVAKQDDERALLAAHLDVIVAAGGDGTVATAAGIAERTSAALAILPLGTANNIAASLGLKAPVPDLVASWSTARRVPFDLGSARAASKEWLVVEGIGGGLVPAGIARAEADSARSTIAPLDEMAAAIRAFREALMDLEPHPWTLVLDGDRISDEFLLVEILNIRSVGPNLALAPDASPCDGRFDVVMAGARHRPDLLTYLTHRAEGREARLELPRHRAQSVVIEGCTALHIDDERVDACDFGSMTIRMKPAAITVLI